MRVFLTGGTGFLGRHLIKALTERGDTCVVLSRRVRAMAQAGVDIVAGDPLTGGEWTRLVSGCDVVVNLAGQTIVDPPKRWTAATRRALVASRVDTTRHVVEAMRRAAAPPALLVSGSAIGYYGPRGDEPVDEQAAAGSDFLAQLALTWEATARATAGKVACLRTGLVLGRDGGVLERLITPFRLGLGGPWGNGRQWWSWIHVADWVGLVLWIIDRKLEGPINLVAPEAVTVNEFAARLGAALGRPAVLRIPAVVLRVALGDAASALLDLQHVTPHRALVSGYRYQFPSLEPALRDILG